MVRSLSFQVLITWEMSTMRERSTSRIIRTMTMLGLCLGNVAAVFLVVVFSSLYDYLHPTAFFLHLLDSVFFFFHPLFFFFLTFHLFIVFLSFLLHFFPPVLPPPHSPFPFPFIMIFLLSLFSSSYNIIYPYQFYYCYFYAPHSHSNSFLAFITQSIQ